MAATSLYRFYDAQDRLLYIGISLDVIRRLQQHRERKAWWSDIARVTVEHHPDRVTALAGEEQAIRNESPLHNIRHNKLRQAAARARGEEPVDSVTDEHRPDRLGAAVEMEFDPGSLVGSFFHSTARPGWQGCVVAEPAPGVYLVELFSWAMGESSNQAIVRLEDMVGWQFYDTAEWMNNTYEYGGLRERWQYERDAEDKGEQR